MPAPSSGCVRQIDGQAEAELTAPVAKPAKTDRHELSHFVVPKQALAVALDAERRHFGIAEMDAAALRQLRHVVEIPDFSGTGTECDEEGTMRYRLTRFKAPASIAWKASITELFLTRVVQPVDVSRNPRRFFHHDTRRGCGYSGSARRSLLVLRRQAPCFHL